MKLVTKLIIRRQNSHSYT